MRCSKTVPRLGPTVSVNAGRWNHIHAGAVVYATKRNDPGERFGYTRSPRVHVGGAVPSEASDSQSSRACRMTNRAPARQGSREASARGWSARNCDITRPEHDHPSAGVRDAAPSLSLHAPCSRWTAALCFIAHPWPWPASRAQRYGTILGRLQAPQSSRVPTSSGTGGPERSTGYGRCNGTCRGAPTVGVSGNDPHLLRWVHICEGDSFLVAYRVRAAELTPHAAEST